MVERDRGITPADIEAKFREIQGQLGDAAEGGKRTLAMVGAAGAVVVILAVYVMGRRSGRKRSTVLEIRRI